MKTPVRCLFAIILALLFECAMAAMPSMRIEATFRQADGRILVAGEAGAGTAGATVRIGRLNPDGTLDTAFGTAGWLTYVDPWGDATQLCVKAIGANAAGDRITIAGVRNGAFELVQLRASDGTPYAGFGDFAPGETRNASAAIGQNVKALLVARDDSIFTFGNYAATPATPVAEIVHYTADGRRDASFGANGSLRLRAGASDSDLNAAVLGADGSMYAAGYARVNADKATLAVKLLPSGYPDRSFGTEGIALEDLVVGSDDEAFGIALDSKGRVLAVGHDVVTFEGTLHGHFTLARFGADGVADMTFCCGGTHVVRMPGQPDNYHSEGGDLRPNVYETAYAAIELPDGGIVIGGTVVETDTGRARFALMRIDAYNVKITPLAEDDHVSTAAYPTPDGNVVLIGTREGLKGDFGLRIRYFVDDATFDTDFPVEGVDASPNPFTLATFTGAAAGQAFTQSFRVTGVNVPVALAVSGGEYSLDACRTFSSQPGIVRNGERVCLRVVAATSPLTTTNARVFVGDATAVLSAVTAELPETRLIGTPATSAPSAAFNYTAEPSGATFECSLDNTPFAPCSSSGITYAALPDGLHIFQVRAVNSLGADPTPASYTWTVSVAPETSITSATPADGSLAASGDATIAFGSNDARAVFECRLDAAPFFACVSPQSYAGLAAGPHAFAVRAIAPSGTADPTPATMGWTVDVTAPDTSILSGPPALGNVPAATFGFASNDASATFECSLDGAAFSACASPAVYGALAEGAHAFAVRAKDLAGNVDATPATAAWTIDSIAPGIAITSGPMGKVNALTVAIGFMSPEPGATFRCYVGVEPPAACTSPATITVPGDGTFTFHVQAADAAGNSSPWSSLTWIVDVSPPDVVITAKPASLTASAGASFTFDSVDLAATFECSIDAGAFAPCTSPAVYSGLGDGLHTFSVRARDSLGNTSAPASWQWRIDLTAPQTTLLSGPQPVTQLGDAAFTFAANESGVTFECRLDGAAWSVCTSPVSLNGMTPGLHTFEARASDAAGNVDASPASQSWTVDPNFGPNTTLTSGPSGTVASTDATFAFTSDVSASSFQCQLDLSAWAACASPVVLGSLGEGAHTFSVKATDPFGNVDTTPASASWTVDTTAPDTTIASGPSGTVATTLFAFTFTSADPAATFQCRLDGGAFQPCSSAYSGSALDGTHTLDVRAVDGAGNTDATPASRTWTVDTLAPNTNILSGPALTTSATGATFEFTADDAAGTFECSLDGAAFSACTSPVVYAGLAGGAHIFLVRALDAVGNTDATAASWNWTVDTTPPDTTPPDTTITSGPDNNSEGPVSFSFTATEPVLRFECAMDAGAYVTCASGVTYSGLTKEHHTFYVRAVDLAGNTDPTPASMRWKVKS